MKRLIYYLVSASVAFAAEGYHVVQKIHVGGDSTWNRLTIDDSARRLYVSNNNRVVVLDIDAGKVVGEIPGTDGTQGIAVAPDLGRGFISNSKSNTVTIFDLKTLKPSGEVAVTTNPGAIIYEPKTGRVFTFNTGSDDSTAIDAKTGAVVQKVGLGGKATSAAIDGSGKIWFNVQVTSEDWNVTSEVAVLDAEKLTIERRNAVASCDNPGDLAIDAKNRRVFTVCGNGKMAVVDADSGDTVTLLTTGKLAAGTGFDPGTGLAFSSNGADGTLSVVGGANGKYEVVESIPTARASRNMALDPKTHNVYLPAVEYAGAAATPTADSFMVLVVGK